MSIRKNILLKKGRGLFNVKDNSELFKIAGAFYANTSTSINDNVSTEPLIAGSCSVNTITDLVVKPKEKKTKKGAGIGTFVANKVRGKMRKDYNISNLRDLTDKDGLAQLPFSNFIGPGTDLDDADKFGAVLQGPASIKGTKNRSFDEIAQTHDYLYYHASNMPKQDRFAAIQDADLHLIEELKYMPKTKTRLIMEKSILAKYMLEKKLGRLVYGGKYFKRKNIAKIGSGYEKRDEKTTLENHIQAILQEKLHMPKTIRTGTLSNKIESTDDIVKKNLKELKKLEDKKKSDDFDESKKKKDDVTAETALVPVEETKQVVEEPEEEEKIDESKYDGININTLDDLKIFEKRFHTFVVGYDKWRKDFINITKRSSQINQAKKKEVYNSLQEYYDDNIIIITELEPTLVYKSGQKMIKIPHSTEVNKYTDLVKLINTYIKEKKKVLNN